MIARLGQTGVEVTRGGQVPLPSENKENYF